MMVHMNTQKIIRNLKFISAAIFLVTLVGAGLIQTPKVSAQACGTTTTPATTYGQVKQSVSVTTAGTFRVWSRLKAPNTTANSYYLQINNGCAINVGDAASIPANTWTWVSYQAGNTTNLINVTLSAGTHNLTYTGKEANVQLDRVLLLSDTTCIPIGTGDNCAVNDTVSPTVSLTAPAGGATVAGTVNVAATAADASGVKQVDFYLDGTLKSTDTVAPYTWSWNTTLDANGAHSLTAKATDNSGNSTTSAARAVTVTNIATGDTISPTVSLTSPVSGTSIVTGASLTINATASDNVGVTKVEFFVDGILKSTDTSSPYSFIWNTAGVSAGVHSLTAKAYDAAGNMRTSSVTSVTIGTSPTTGNGDANGDGRVNALDLSILISKDGQNFPAADFNGDGTVGAADLAILLSKWTW